MSENDQTSDEEARVSSGGAVPSEEDVLIQQNGSKDGGTPTYTIYVYLLSTFAALGGFLFGYDTGVVSGAMLPLTEEFSLTDRWKEFLVSITIGTAIVGTVIGGVLNDKIGRRPVLLICSAVFTSGAVVMGVSNSKEVLLLGRGIVGFGIGKDINLFFHLVWFAIISNQNWRDFLC
jgi:SP family myo-inositol transporter-like MFS transporter 13